MSSDATAVRRSLTGGLPSQDVPDLALLGVAESTATSEFFGTLRPARGHPRVAQKGPFADLGGGDLYPAAAELIGRHHGVVREEGPLAHGRHLGQQEDRGGLDVLPHFGAQQPQPDRGEEARVDGEEQVAGHVQDPLRRPDLPADAAAHPVVALRQPRAQQPRDRQNQQQVGQEPGEGSQRQRGQELRPGSGQGLVSPDEQEHHHCCCGRGCVGDHGQHRRGAGKGGKPQPADEGARRRGIRPILLGLAAAFGRGSRHQLPGFDLAEHSGARLHLPAGANARAGHEGAAGADRRPGADVDVADVHHVAVDPPSGKVHFGLDVAAVAERQEARHRRQRMQVDVAPDLGTERPGVVRNPRCAGKADGTGEVLDLLGQPEPQMHPAGPRIGAGHNVPEQQAGCRDRDGHPPQRADENQPRCCDPPPGEHRSRRETPQRPPAGCSLP